MADRYARKPLREQQTRNQYWVALKTEWEKETERVECIIVSNLVEFINFCKITKNL